MTVIQAARRALKELTGQGFGPDEGADRRARARDADAWRKWWKENANTPK